MGRFYKASWLWHVLIFALLIGVSICQGRVLIQYSNPPNELSFGTCFYLDSSQSAEKKHTVDLLIEPDKPTSGDDDYVICSTRALEGKGDLFPNDVVIDERTKQCIYYYTGQSLEKGSKEFKKEKGSTRVMMRFSTADAMFELDIPTTKAMSSGGYKTLTCLVRPSADPDNPNDNSDCAGLGVTALAPLPEVTLPDDEPAKEVEYLQLFQDMFCPQPRPSSVNPGQLSLAGNAGSHGHDGQLPKELIILKTENDEDSPLPTIPTSLLSSTTPGALISVERWHHFFKATHRHKDQQGSGASGYSGASSGSFHTYSLKEEASTEYFEQASAGVFRQKTVTTKETITSWSDQGACFTANPEAFSQDDSLRTSMREWVNWFSRKIINVESVSDHERACFKQALDYFGQALLLTYGIVYGKRIVDFIDQYHYGHLPENALIRLAVNYYTLTTSSFPHSPANPPFDQWQQTSYRDQHSSVPLSQRSVPYGTHAADSQQSDIHGGARPKTRRPAAPENNGTPTHLSGNVYTTLGSDCATGIDPKFLSLHSQDDYYKDVDKVKADLKNRAVDRSGFTKERYDAGSLLPSDYQNAGNSGLYAYNTADLPPCPTVAAAAYQSPPPDQSWGDGCLSASAYNSIDLPLPPFPAVAATAHQSLPPDQSYNSVDLPSPPFSIVTADPGYHGRPRASVGSRVQQSGNPAAAARAHQQPFMSMPYRSTGVAEGFPAAPSGTGYASYSQHPKKSPEATKATGTGAHRRDVEIPGRAEAASHVKNPKRRQPDAPVPASDNAASGSDSWAAELIQIINAASDKAERRLKRDPVSEGQLSQSQREQYRRADQAFSVYQTPESPETRAAREEEEERKEFDREMARKEREIRAERARKKREAEARELDHAESWPEKQEAITGKSIWLCEHYQRHCRVKFPCCNDFYSCHRCHNNSKNCDNEEAKASHATHYKCNYCHNEAEIGEGSQKCKRCTATMSAYFCPTCKHFTSIDKNPYHCEKCGICRIHKDKSFHCDVCNVCLDKRLEGKHKCRPDSGHDECCICLEDAFSGCQILPCSHKVHRECAIAMIQNGIRTCPVCRHPLYSPAPD
ncbi:CHY zinc finger protein [Candidatus Sororendozoicomonas aggregata]|uniref:CHY zinc finger protein n=1 Tax=Candidatus Sororendozoicomonas aggregata TaxID=3073239 RepID=UPI002ECFD63F